MCAGSLIAGVSSSSQSLPDDEFDTEGHKMAANKSGTLPIVKPIDPERVAHTVQELLRQPLAEKADYRS